MDFTEVTRDQLVVDHVTPGARRLMDGRVLRCLEGNRYGHPDAEVLDRAADIGAAVLRTDKMGTIEVTTDGQQMWWESHQ